MAGLGSEVSSSQMCEFFDRLGRFGGDMSMVKALLGDDDLMQCAVDAIDERLSRNPYEITVEETLTRFRAQNKLGDWGFADEIFDKLAATAPSWPKGSDAFRSLRIRFGEGDEGVALTFEQHAEAIKRAFSGKVVRWDHLLSGKSPYEGEEVERLRLLNGNQTHHATVEWIIVDDLSANRRRASVRSVSRSESLADEGLVLVWLFPDRVHVIDHKTFPAWFCAGYELNAPEQGGTSWYHAVIVFLSNDDRSKVFLTARGHYYDYSGYSVPFLSNARSTT